MNRKIHKLYDIILKILILAYMDEFLKYIGETRKISEVLQTEITTLNGKTRHLDFLCRLEDNTLLHIEFQFPVAYTDDLDRFFNYNVVSEIRYDKVADSIIFNFTSRNYGNAKTSIGTSKDFHPRPFYLGDIDFEKELEIINIKLGLGLLENIINPYQSNIKLTYQEELHLQLMSLAPKYKNKDKLLNQAAKLLKNETIFHEEKINIVKAIIKMEIDNLVNNGKQEDFEGEIKMTNEAEQIIMQAVTEVNRKYEQEALDQAEQKGREKGREEGREEGIKKGREEGIEKGREDTQIDIAKKLKTILAPEEISKITGLALSTIILL